MFDSTSRFKQHSQAVCTELDGDVALFQSNTCDYLVLNETGSAIWNALKSRPTLPELCKHLQGEYDVTADECNSAVESWLEAALEKKVIALVDD
jgi:hypothetical protein|tara:strand:- start:390 stop:671 length:282 start_codon:yes stop_codon:yes gene_type:complete